MDQQQNDNDALCPQRQQNDTELNSNYSSVAGFYSFNQSQPVFNQFVNPVYNSRLYPNPWTVSNPGISSIHQRQFEEIKILQNEIKKKDESIKYLRAKVKKQHKEIQALQSLLDDITNQKKVIKQENDGSSDEIIWESIVKFKNPNIDKAQRKKKRKRYEFIKDEDCIKKRRKLNTNENGGVIAYISGAQKLIFTGKNGGKYWMNKNGRKYYIDQSNSNGTSNNSKELALDNTNNKDVGLKIFSVSGEYGGEFAFIQGVKQLILTGLLGGKYWIDKNGKKRRISKWHMNETHDGMNSMKLDNHDENEYDVEKLLNHRESAHGMEYFVKWRDYDLTHASWEPSANILNEQLIEKYWKENTKSIDMEKFEFADDEISANIDGIFDGLNGIETEKIKATMNGIQNDYKKHIAKQSYVSFIYILYSYQNNLHS